MAKAASSDYPVGPKPKSVPKPKPAPPAVVRPDVTLGGDRQQNRSGHDRAVSTPNAPPAGPSPTRGRGAAVHRRKQESRFAAIVQKRLDAVKQIAHQQRQGAQLAEILGSEAPVAEHGVAEKTGGAIAGGISDVGDLVKKVAQTAHAAGAAAAKGTHTPELVRAGRKVEAERLKGATQLKGNFHTDAKGRSETKVALRPIGKPDAKPRLKTFRDVQLPDGTFLSAHEQASAARRRRRRAQNVYKTTRGKVALQTAADPGGVVLRHGLAAALGNEKLGKNVKSGADLVMVLSDRAALKKARRYERKQRRLDEQAISQYGTHAGSIETAGAERAFKRKQEEKRASLPFGEKILRDAGDIIHGAPASVKETIEAYAQAVPGMPGYLRARVRGESHAKAAKEHAPKLQTLSAHFREDDPLGRLLTGDVKGAARAASGRPLAAALEVAGTASVVGRVTGRHRPAVRARPDKRQLTPDRHQPSTAREARGRLKEHRRDAKDTARGRAPGRERVAGDTVRQYARSPAIRQVQKRVEDVRAALGKDPTLRSAKATDRAAKRGFRRGRDSERAASLRREVEQAHHVTKVARRATRASSKAERQARGRLLAWRASGAVREGHVEADLKAIHARYRETLGEGAVETRAARYLIDHPRVARSQRVAAGARDLVHVGQHVEKQLEDLGVIERGAREGRLARQGPVARGTAGYVHQGQTIPESLRVKKQGGPRRTREGEQQSGGGGAQRRLPERQPEKPRAKAKVDVEATLRAAAATKKRTEPLQRKLDEIDAELEAAGQGTGRMRRYGDEETLRRLDRLERRAVRVRELSIAKKVDHELKRVPTPEDVARAATVAEHAVQRAHQAGKIRIGEIGTMSKAAKSRRQKATRTLGPEREQTKVRLDAAKRAPTPAPEPGPRRGVGRSSSQVTVSGRAGVGKESVDRAADAVDRAHAELNKLRKRLKPTGAEKARIAELEQFIARPTPKRPAQAPQATPESPARPRVAARREKPAKPSQGPQTASRSGFAGEKQSPSDVTGVRFARADGQKTDAPGQPLRRQGWTGEDIRFPDADRDPLIATLAENQRAVGQARVFQELERWGSGLTDTQSARQHTARQAQIGRDFETVSLSPALVERLAQRDHLSPAELDELLKDAPDGSAAISLPRHVIEEWKRGVQAPGSIAAAGQVVTRAFLRAALPLSVMWHAGNMVDLTTRAAVHGAGPISHHDFTVWINELRQLDPARADRITALVQGHFGSRRAVLSEPRIRDVFQRERNGLEHALYELTSKVGDSAPLRAATKLPNAIVDKAFDAGYRTERQLVETLMGKALADSAKMMGQRQLDHVALAKRALEDDSFAEALQQSTIQMIGDYTRSPAARVFSPVDPFWAWFKASMKFTFHTLPVKHPIKAAMLAAAVTMTEKERERIGLSYFITPAEAKALRLPQPIEDGFLAGAIPVGGGRYIPVSPFSSFGEAAKLIPRVDDHGRQLLANPVTALAGRLFPFAQGPIATLLGRKTTAGALVGKLAAGRDVSSFGMVQFDPKGTLASQLGGGFVPGLRPVQRATDERNAPGLLGNPAVNPFAPRKPYPQETPRQPRPLPAVRKQTTKGGGLLFVTDKGKKTRFAPHPLKAVYKRPEDAFGDGLVHQYGTKGAPGAALAIAPYSNDVRSSGGGVAPIVTEDGLDLVKPGRTKGGKVVLGGGLQKYNRTFPEHGLGESGHTLSQNEVRYIAEELGASPAWALEFSEVAQGESGLRPGIRGDDPGGTKGWGLGQITPGVQGPRYHQFMAQHGWTESDLRNPVINTQVAMWMDGTAGGNVKNGNGSWSNWYGTSMLHRGRPAASVASVLGKRGRGRRPQDGMRQFEVQPGRTVDLEQTDTTPEKFALVRQLFAGQIDILGFATGITAIEGQTSGKAQLKLKGGKAAPVFDIEGKLRDVVARAQKMDRMGRPYVWGGGHGPVPDADGPWDCSGAISALLGISPRTATLFRRFGKAGAGKHFTIYANDEHVFVKIGSRFFGTSRSNPAGGAGWIDESQMSRGYLAGFDQRHIPGL